MMDTTVLFFPRGNDVVVTAQFPGISDGTGMSSKLYTKPDKTTPDNDPTVITYTASIVPDPANAGQTMSKFNVPRANTGVPGAYWWRVDVTDVTGKNRTANCGTLLVESV